VEYLSNEKAKERRIIPWSICSEFRA
jgi:hypothetical protein